MPMTWWLSLFLLAGAAYVVGATPFGFLAGRARGVDIRQHGSGNIGATNVGRILGKKLGLTVFVLDVLKGLLPVVLVELWASRSPLFQDHPVRIQLAGVLTGLAVVVGHTATFWLRFKGGKGVATAAGVMLGLAPWAFLAALVVWSATMAVTRFVSLASLLAAWALPVATATIEVGRGSYNWPLLALTLALAVLVTARHRSNIQRLLAGTEPRAGRRKQPS
jgi:glycerol-3-phosphate acyltransferase PlsY